MISAAAAAGTLVAAFAAGLVDAIVGGGGLIQLPALFGALPHELPSVLLGTSKLAGVMGTSAASLRYSRHIALPWRLLLPGCLIGVAGGLAGAAVATHVAAVAYRPLVPAMLTVVLVISLSARGSGLKHAPNYGGSRPGRAAAWTGAISLYDGFFGPGTGTFFMFMLIRVLGFDFLHAAASARVLNVSTNVAALTWFAGHGAVLPGLGLAMGASNVAGSLVGARLALRGGAPLVRKAFIAVVLVLIAKTAFDAWHGLAAG